MTTLIKNQKRTFGPKTYTEDGQTYRITATVRHDDQCGNGHNSFGITGAIDRKSGNRWVEDSGGCLHEAIARHFPELAPYFKWHLCSTDRPLHYIGDTVYHVSEREDLDAARRTAIWPEATDDDLTAPDLEERLNERLPALLAEFRVAVESLGFTY